MNDNVDGDKVLQALLQRAVSDKLIDEILRSAILEVRLAESMKDTKALLDQQDNRAAASEPTEKFPGLVAMRDLVPMEEE